MKSVFQHSFCSVSLAFSNPNGKARPSIHPPTSSPTVTTGTDSRFRRLLQIRPAPAELLSLFKYDPTKKLDKADDAKVGDPSLGLEDCSSDQITQMKRKLAGLGFVEVGDEQLQYGLFSRYANQGESADVDKAVELVILFQQSVDGVIRPYDPKVEMKGAVNNRGVTCWLDSLLFSMFARLQSFEPILYTIYYDPPRRRLSTLLRLWVNMLRSGMLIPTDVVSL
jgi:hypothetical protein